MRNTRASKRKNGTLQNHGNNIMEQRHETQNERNSKTWNKEMKQEDETYRKSWNKNEFI